MRSSTRRILVAAWTVGVTAVLAVVLFLIAGDWDLPFFWAYIGVAGVISLSAMMLMDPDLLKERRRPGPGGRDRFVIYVLKALIWAHLIFAALDIGRLHWSDSVPSGLQVAGLVGFAAGFGVAIWAMIINRFFSSVIRLQEDREHHLITGGPYRFVRHPGYTGIAVGILSSPLALGSWLSAVPMVVFVLLILRRTILEDSFLRQSLRGYPEYAAEVRFRLIPGLW